MLQEEKPELVQKLTADYGFENYTSEPTDDEPEYKKSKEKVKSSFQAIQKRNKQNFQRDVANFERMIERKPLRPPHRLHELANV